jgi:hypothetical protein
VQRYPRRQAVVGGTAGAGGGAANVTIPVFSRVLVVGVGGPPRAGKSSVALLLRDGLPGRAEWLLCVEDYLLPRRAGINVESSTGPGEVAPAKHRQPQNAGRQGSDVPAILPSTVNWARYAWRGSKSNRAAPCLNGRLPAGACVMRGSGVRCVYLEMVDYMRSCER